MEGRLKKVFLRPIPHSPPHRHPAIQRRREETVYQIQHKHPVTFPMPRYGTRTNEYIYLPNLSVLRRTRGGDPKSYGNAYDCYDCSLAGRFFFVLKPALAQLNPRKLPPTNSITTAFYLQKIMATLGEYVGELSGVVVEVAQGEGGSGSGLRGFLDSVRSKFEDCLSGGWKNGLFPSFVADVLYLTKYGCGCGYEQTPRYSTTSKHGHLISPCPLCQIRRPSR